MKLDEDLHAAVRDHLAVPAAGDTEAVGTTWPCSMVAATCRQWPCTRARSTTRIVPARLSRKYSRERGYRQPAAHQVSGCGLIEMAEILVGVLSTVAVVGVVVVVVVVVRARTE